MVKPEVVDDSPSIPEEPMDTVIKTEPTDEDSAATPAPGLDGADPAIADPIVSEPLPSISTAMDDAARENIQVQHFWEAVRSEMRRKEMPVDIDAIHNHASFYEATRFLYHS